MKHIAIIPARSGSKGLKGKNIKELNGKPLMAYTIEAALQSGIFDCVHVSTDSEEYARIAVEYGADVPFLRDADLAGDTSSTWDALRFVLQEYEKRGCGFDLVTLLQPTSPLRNAENIKEAYAIFQEKSADAVISVCEMEHSIQICNKLEEDGSMYHFIDSNKVGARQEEETYYRLNGAIYIQKTEILMNKQNLYNEKSYAYIMDQLHSVDIDQEIDFLVAEVLMKQYNHQNERL